MTYSKCALLWAGILGVYFGIYLVSFPAGAEEPKAKPVSRQTLVQFAPYSAQYDGLKPTDRGTVTSVERDSDDPKVIILGVNSQAPNQPPFRKLVMVDQEDADAFKRALARPNANIELLANWASGGGRSYIRTPDGKNAEVELRGYYYSRDINVFDPRDKSTIPLDVYILREKDKEHARAMRAVRTEQLKGHYEGLDGVFQKIKDRVNGDGVYAKRAQSPRNAQNAEKDLGVAPEALRGPNDPVPLPKDAGATIAH